MRTLLGTLKYLVLSVVILLVVISLVELVFRLIPSCHTEWMDYNSVTIWRTKANNVGPVWSEERPEFIQTINRDGFNDINHPLAKKKGTKRIMVIGDSFTAGLYFPVSETFPGILQQLLNEKYPDTYEVMNSAVPAWGTEQEFLYFVNEGKKYNPDYVLLMIAPNDIRESYTRNLLSVHDGKVETWLINPMTKKEKLLWKLSAHSCLVHWLQERGVLHKVNFDEMLWKYFGKAFPDMPAGMPWEAPVFLKQPLPSVNDAYERLTVILNSFNTQAKNINSILLVSTLPSVEEFNGMLADTAIYESGRVSVQFDSVCNWNNIPYCNMFNDLNKSENPSSIYQKANGHFNLAGDKYIANEMFKFLEGETNKR